MMGTGEGNKPQRTEKNKDRNKKNTCYSYALLVNTCFARASTTEFFFSLFSFF